jgi:uncharacterized protein (UPF0335 family)
MTTAAQHNENTEAKRQRARDKSSNVVDLTLDDATRAERIRDITAEFERLKAEGKAINEMRKACLERVDALGLDRNEFRSLTKLLEVDEEKRSKKHRTRREFLRAHNLPEQGDMFVDVTVTTITEGQTEPTVDPQLGELRRRWAEEDARDAAENAAVEDEDFVPTEEIEEDPDLYSRAGVTVVAGEDDDG